MSNDSVLCPTLAVFGTASDVGKSLIAAGLCRLLSDAGYRVAPYKAQNMSNNSAVTKDGGEMGRAQVVQAWAARVEPHVDMNPVLLKPGSEDGSQVVLLGHPWKNRDARTYFQETALLAEHAYAALRRLRKRHDCVVLEGAGSCAEVNLRSREFVNFPAAHEANSAVVLVADIERGGVFAQIVGSLEVMRPEDRERVVGFIVNRFRGDRTLFDDGVRYLEEKTGKPVFGVVPFVHRMDIDSEDSLRLDAPVDPAAFSKTDAGLRIAVLALPRISNSTDFDALLDLDAVELHFLRRARDLSAYDLVILPGSKSVRADLAWLGEWGWTERLREYRARGGRLAGICGGYQMLGSKLHDPDGVEGPAGNSDGLGFLPVETTLAKSKVLGNVCGRWAQFEARVEGYEIHMGRTTRIGRDDGFGPVITELRPLGPADGSDPAAAHMDGLESSYTDGLTSVDGAVWGTYLHGLFDSREFLSAFLRRMCPALSRELEHDLDARAERRERSLSAWAEHLRQHVDVEALLATQGLSLRLVSPSHESAGDTRDDPACRSIE